MVKQTTRYKIAALVGILILVYYKFIYLREPSWDSLSADELDNINLIGRLEVKDIQKHDKWIVLTTIQAPTLAIQMLAELKDWRLVVVGDRKTPKNWRYVSNTRNNLKNTKLMSFKMCICYCYLINNI